MVDDDDREDGPTAIGCELIRKVIARDSFLSSIEQDWHTRDKHMFG